MFVRLSRNGRTKSARVVALLYLLCMMAPTLSYALPASGTPSHCRPLQTVAAMSDQLHEDHTMHAATAEVHLHDRAIAADDAMAVDHAMALPDVDQDQSSASPFSAEHQSSSGKGPHTGSGKCCVLMCVSGMPALTSHVTAPVVAGAARAMSDDRGVPGSAPPEHYRPPIA